MAINKIEYKYDSMTTGFASAGEEVTVKKSNAETIQKDVDDNRTEELTGPQQKFLTQCAESSKEDTDYEGGENPDGELGDNGGPGAGEGVAMAAQTGAAMFFGSLALEVMKLNTPKMCAWVAPWVGAINVGVAESSIVSAAMFDSEYSQRTSERSSESEYADILDQTIEALNADLESIKGNEQVSKLMNMQNEYQGLLDEGKTEEADALLGEMDEIRNSLSEGDEAIDMEAFATNNEFAHEFDNYTRGVSEFLKTGSEFGRVGLINSVALVACTAASVVMSVFAFRAVNLANVSMAASGAALCVIASAMYAIASAVMINKSIQEFDCGSKGKDLEAKANELAKPLEQHDETGEALGIIEEVTEETENITNEEGGDGTTTGGDTGSGSTEGGSSAGGGSTGGGSTGGGSTTT